MPSSNSIDSADIEATFEVSAPYTNRFFVTVGPGGVRLTFAETHPEVAGTFPRAAAMMSVQDAVELKNLLTELLAPIEAKLQAHQPSGPANG